MSTNDHTNEECTDLEKRDARALEQYLTVLPRGPDVYDVVSESGKNYVVDTRQGACECPDYEYRGETCKHQRRVAFATGERPIPIGADADPQLGLHVDATPRVAVTDGGEEVVDLATVTGDAPTDEGADARPESCECRAHDEDVPCWPCYHAGFESVNPDAPPLDEEDGDEWVENDDGDQVPRRSESADFGHGETTGVIDL